RVSRPDRDGARQIFSRYLTEEIPRQDSVDKLITAGVDAIYTDRPFVEIRMDDADVVMHYRDFVSGAMIANVVDRAKKEAIKDHIAGRTTGLSVGHILTAVDTELKESGDLPNTSDPDSWARIAGIQGSRITEIKVVG
ncbi:MAG TPA: proteasome ATPase, partial [Corynebacterium sp.]|nr:proteasome ATPase [Corynebacterium sp.]